MAQRASKSLRPVDDLLKLKEVLKVKPNAPPDEQFIKVQACAFIIWKRKLMLHMYDMLDKCETFGNTLNPVGHLLEHYKRLGERGNKRVDNVEQSLNTAFRDIKEYIEVTTAEFSSVIERGNKELEAGKKTFTDLSFHSLKYYDIVTEFKNTVYSSTEGFNKFKELQTANYEKHIEIRNKRTQVSYRPQKVTEDLKPLDKLLGFSKNLLFSYSSARSCNKRQRLIQLYICEMTIYLAGFLEMESLVKELLVHYKTLDGKEKLTQLEADKKRKISVAFKQLPEWIKTASEELERCILIGEVYTNGFKESYKNSKEENYRDTIQEFNNAQKSATYKVSESERRIRSMHSEYKEMRRIREDRKSVEQTSFHHRRK